MEETQELKVAKARSKHSKQEVSTQVKDLLENAIPLHKAVFKNTVESWTGDPEMALFASGAKPSRTAKLWLTPTLVIAEQRGGFFLLVPLANVTYTRPL